MISEIMPTVTPSQGKCYETCFLVNTDLLYTFLYLKELYEHIFLNLLENLQENVSCNACECSKDIGICN